MRTLVIVLIGATELMYAVDDKVIRKIIFKMKISLH